jgi:hypothetical protein
MLALAPRDSFNELASLQVTTPIITLLRKIVIQKEKPRDMAEVVGVVASGIAVAQLGVGFGKALAGLKTLWGEIKDIPRSIQCLMEEVELLKLTLDEIDADLNRHTSDTESSRSVRPILRYCQAAEQSLFEIVNTLRSQIDSSKSSLKRGVGKVRVGLKKDCLEAHERRLQRVVSLLALANQEYVK